MRLKRHRCGIRLIAGTVLLSTGLMTLPPHVSATDLSSLKQQYAALQQQQQQLQSQLQSQTSQVQTEQAKQASLSAEVAITQKQLAILKGQSDSINAQIANKEQEIAVSQQQLDQNYNLLKQRLRAMYVSGDDSFLVVLLNSNGVSDFLNRIEMVKAVSNHDNRIISDLRQAQDQLNADKKALDEAKQDLLQTQGTMAAKQDMLNAQLAQQAQVVTQAQASAQNTQQTASAVNQQAAQTDAQINAEIAAEAAAAKAAAAKAAQASASFAAPAAAQAPSSQGGGSQTTGSTPARSSTSSNSSNTGSAVSTPSPNTPPSPQSGFGSATYVVSYAKNFLHYPYIFGTAGPSTFDCSGFVQYVYAHAAGIYLTHSAAEQSQAGSSVSKGSLQPGDLVFFNVDGGGIDHVGIYIGGGQMINAENPGVGVIYDNINSGYWAARYAGAQRILN
ncbi:MAG: NlpC/P60 family protein [Ethanoligenens sp.]|uniref:C40 family peptidase n=1 Tax=Ethanoligenens sp. TaxID=2099655 RepID=UPI0039E847F3